MGADIFIISSTALNSQLLQRVLGEAFGGSCQTVLSIDEARASHGESNERRLLLVDCADTDIESFLLEVSASNGAVSHLFRIALMGLKHGTGVEQRALHLGVRGFFYEDTHLSLLLRGIQTVLAGEIWVPRNVLLTAAMAQSGNGNGRGKASADDERREQLTGRETEVLLRVCLGKSNEEIADDLFISKHTVRTHLYNVFKKIEVPNRLQAALWASKNL